MRHARRRAAEGQGSCMQLTKRQATERFNPELKLPRLMSAKNSLGGMRYDLREMGAVPGFSSITNSQRHVEG
ncbi:hypothetical protein VN21_16360, partial [Paraclostridium benzoelyticum]